MGKNDNRQYDYRAFPEEGNREEEYRFILSQVSEGASVIDLGCGNGNLLALLREQKNIVPAGVEIAQSGTEICLEKGLQVTQGRIDEPLPFEDNQFDFAVCNVTIQMTMYPEVLLREMKRVAQYQILSFPNFGYIKNRLFLLLKGRMPQQTLYGYQWYSTGHIHQLSTADFLDLVNTIGGLEVVKRHTIKSGSGLLDFLTKVNGNLFDKIVFFVLKKTG